MQTQIRLLLKEQSGQGLHSLTFCLHLSDPLLHHKTKMFHSRTIVIFILYVPFFFIIIFLYASRQAKMYGVKIFISFSGSFMK